MKKLLSSTSLWLEILPYVKKINKLFASEEGQLLTEFQEIGRNGRITWKYWTTSLHNFGEKMKDKKLSHK